MKLHIVKYSAGSYDDYREYIYGIFDNEEIAEQHASTIEEHYEKMIEKPNPIGHDDWEKMSEAEDEL